MASLVWPDWLSDLPSDKLAVVRAVGLRPWTMPKSFWFGREAPRPEPAPVVVTAPTDLDDREWATLREFFPSRSVRKNAVDWRLALNGLVYLKSSGVRWSHTPRRYSTPGALRKSAERAAVLGLWGTLLERLDETDLSPERKRTLGLIAREWQRRGQKYARQRT